VTPVAITAIEPERWVLVFQRESKVWWVRWLARGRYRHVAAYAYLPGFKAWLIYDVNMIRTSIAVVPDGDEALGWLYELTKDADLMAFRRQPGAARTAPLLGWCVPAIKHLIGLRSGALRPDTLFRDCLAAGGQPLDARRSPEICSAAA
jgi:hypothetical protein